MHGHVKQSFGVESISIASVIGMEYLIGVNSDGE